MKMWMQFNVLPSYITTPFNMHGMPDLSSILTADLTIVKPNLITQLGL